MEAAGKAEGIFKLFLDGEFMDVSRYQRAEKTNWSEFFKIYEVIDFNGTRFDAIR